MACVETKEFTVFGLKLWQQVLIGLLLGIIAGYVFGDKITGLKIFGTIFLNLIKLVAPLLIFFALVTGITSMYGSSNLSRVSFKGFGAYLMTACFAVMLGILTGVIVEPGKGLDVATLAPFLQEIPEAAKSPPTLQSFILDLFPSNIVKSFVEEKLLHVVLFSIFTGTCLNMIGGKGERLRETFAELAQLAFKMIEMIIRLAPLAVFGLMAYTVAVTGSEALERLAWLVVAVLGACTFQYLMFGVLIIVFARLSPLPFYRKMLRTQALAFSTSSSKATLTTAMSELQTKLGVSEKTVNFMMPLGASINMDGTAIYLGICALFFAQLYGIELNHVHYITLILTCTLGSIGAAGIPSGSIIFMGMVLSSVGIPIEGIGLILGVDRILDMFRTTVNITGDSTITLIIDKSEKTLDEKLYYS